MEDKDDIFYSSGGEENNIPNVPETADEVLNNTSDENNKSSINLVKSEASNSTSVYENSDNAVQNAEQEVQPANDIPQQTVNSEQVGMQDVYSQMPNNSVPPVNENNAPTTPPPVQNGNAAPPPQNGNAAPPPQNNNAPRRPVYDEFMYQPIGFDGYNNRANIPPEGMYNNMQNLYPNPEKEKKNESLTTMLLIILLIICILISVFGIVYDVVNSKRNLGKIGNVGNVVLYSENKPEGANDLENFKDENGKYTTEGVAALVRPSIVEIYVYSDAAHKELIGTGSGIVISKDGYIVTNAHVLSTEGYHTVKTIDDDTFGAKIVGRDAKTDIAVIKVNANDLTPAVLGNSDEAVVGEAVIAIGNPANLSSTVTDGIISAIKRQIRGESTGFDMECIQTNADISPGNSGGALVNMYGQVIGVTSSKYVSSSFEGLGFAISINEVKPIIEELINNGFIAGRFRIGIQLIDMSNASKRELIEETIKEELPEDFKGIYISEISEDCDIAKTELKPGDFITEINEVPVSTYDELYNKISGNYAAGDKVPATCARFKDGKFDYFNIEFKLMEDTSGDY